MKTSRSKQRRFCSCKWDNCENFRTTLLTNMSEEHVWCSKIIEIKFHNRKFDTMSVKMYALYMSIRRHILKQSDEIMVPSVIYLHPHHFPISLLTWMNKQPRISHFSKELSAEETRSIDANHMGSQRFYDYNNSVMFYHNIDLSKKLYSRNVLIDKKFMKVYVKSPLTLPSEITFNINTTLTSLKRKRPLTIDVNPTLKSNEKELVSDCDTVSRSHNSDKACVNYAAAVQVRPMSPLIVPDIEKLKTMLVDKYANYVPDKSLFNTSKSVLEISKLLSIFHGNYDIIKLSDCAYYYPCKNSSTDKTSICETFSIQQRRHSTSRLCKPCREFQKLQNRKFVRVIESPTRSRPFNCLTPDDQTKAYHNEKYKLKLMNKRYDKLITKLELKKNSLCFGNDSPAKEEIEEACLFIKANWSQCKNELLKTLLEIQTNGEDDKRDKHFSNDDRERLAQYISESISNLMKQINGNESQTRYSSHAINLSMSLFLKNKSMYDELRDKKLMSLPSPRMLYKKQSILKPSPGVDPSSMEFMKDLRQRSTGSIIGHLMMDEIKLKNGIMWNCKNNEVTGFIHDELNMKDIMMDILGLSVKKNKNNAQMRAYANQWRFRSTVGHVHNGFYYYNKGTLSCNDIAEQFIDAIIYYESIGIQIHGLVCDGGGSNESFLHKIVEKLCFEGKIIDMKSVSMIHPFDSTRRIFFWSCGTHSQKATRNNLFRSKLKGSKNLRLNKYHFGWNEVESIYKRDDERFKNNNYKKTDIVKQTIYLDSFTMMNATYAKQPFTSKTISEVLSYLSVRCCVKFPERDLFQSEWHKFNKYSTMLESPIEKMSTMTVKSEYSLLRYQIAIHGIYVERLLNHRWKLTRTNIDKEEEIILSIVSFFYEWKMDNNKTTSEDGTDTRDAERYFIAKKTYHNMLSLVHGFIGYARQILNKSETVEYIPALHCNQSSIEGLFSHIRANDKDRTDIYGIGIMQQNIRSQMKHNEKCMESKAYPQNESERPMHNSDIPFCFNSLCTNIVNKTEIIDKDIKGCLMRKRSKHDTFILPQDEVSNKEYQGVLLLPKLQQFVLPDGKTYQQYMANDKCFNKIMQLLHGGIEYQWIKDMLDITKNDQMNKVCQYVNLNIYNLFCDSHDSEYGKGQFNLCMINEMQKRDKSIFESIFKTHMPNIHNNSIQNYVFRWLVINWLKEKFFTDWIRKVVEQMKAQIDTSIGTKLSSLESNKPVALNDDDVNRMFGWALFKTRRKYNNWCKNDTVEEQITEKLNVIMDMCVDYKDVLHNERYVRLYYPLDESIRNKGNLTLIRPNYCNQFSSILSHIKRIVKYMTEVNDNKIPDKDTIRARLKMEFDSDDHDDIKVIVETMRKRVFTKLLHDDELESIVWELIERVLNATVGEFVREYRRQVLVRVNTVAFRTELAVKSEKKQVK